MNDTLSLLLREVAESTLEGLAFMFSLPEEGSSEGESPIAHVARVNFSGPFTGSVEVGASADMLPALASNMLGLECDVVPTAEHQIDSLKELTNVLCGNLLPKLAGTEPVFDVSAPHVLAKEEIRSRAPTACLDLALDEGNAHVALYLDEGAAVPALAEDSSIA